MPEAQWCYMLARCPLGYCHQHNVICDMSFRHEYTLIMNKYTVKQFSTTKHQTGHQAPSRPTDPHGDFNFNDPGLTF